MNKTELNERSFTTSIMVDESPMEAFVAINAVQRWWTENLTGGSQNLNDEFEVRFGDIHYSKQKVTELIPARKVAWLVTASRLGFVKDESEWTNTKVSFEICRRGNKTEVCFTHSGLVPELECFNDCSTVWIDYIKSLQKLISTGKGEPAAKETGR